MKFDNAGPRKVYNFDLDGVLAMGGPFWEREPEPNPVLIEKVRELYQAGNVIIIWTARLWEYAPETVGWLTKHKVPFHGIYMSKGGADVYIDDKAVNLEAWTGPTVIAGDDKGNCPQCDGKGIMKQPDEFGGWESLAT